MKSNLKPVLMVLVIVVLSIILDQITKQIAYNTLSIEGHPKPAISFLDGFFLLTYVENEGAFLSMGSNLPSGLRVILLTVLPAILLIAMVIYVFRSRHLIPLERVAIALIAGGGIGNIIDRLAFGKVVDFMNLGIGNLRTGIFNVADLYIVVGIGLFLVAYLKHRRHENGQEAEPGSEGNPVREDRGEKGDEPDSLLPATEDEP